jgi:NAD(P)-dependent dehydrogenase (short-subunit alcohol dehydrogenase family)
MSSLAGKKVVVIGGSRAVGRQIARATARNTARVLAVAREEGPLRPLAKEVPGLEAL